MDNFYQQQLKELIDNLGDWFKEPERLDEGKITNRLQPYSKLFEPIQINGVK